MRKTKAPNLRCLCSMLVVPGVAVWIEGWGNGKEIQGHTGKMWCFQGFGKALGDAGNFWRGVFFLRDIKLTSRDANLVTLTHARDIWHDVLWYHHLLNHYLPRQVAGVIDTTWLVNKWIVHNRLHLLCVCIYVYIHLIKDSSWVSIQTCLLGLECWFPQHDSTKSCCTNIRATNLIPQTCGRINSQLWSPCNSSV